ncbi:TRAP transporter large permease [Allosediminivita pacifica]|uniref:TRAP transporter large permease protein n=1 Tax=Allosediminivita pacifica TaxID=1267769 RepID=A0A2T6AR27_9RHOB|nr:TRAP transporter large permease subunit [Allosediminivita pacifica]PTX46262.1 tripartite ATP-independent transporter DctM subunit [Allosediminivita pacifica]GGB17696.1 C4-dicarboxylate ABC transporter permease [Allosediminivita pacifica]
MSITFSAGVLVALLALFLGAGVWIFSGLMLVGASAMYFVLDFNLVRIGAIATRVISSSAISWELAAIPIFMWMGDIIFRTDISQRLFRGLAPLVARIPGGLLHTNVFGCTVFAAISGSSTATTATVGKITIPELQKRGYDLRLSAGSLAGAGSFGLLIPPSIAMIVYGVLAEVSIAQLFAAGVIPGLMMAGLYVGYIAIVSLMDPSRAPRFDGEVTARAMGRGLLELLPIVLLMFVVLGSIYSGLATPSEAAAVGVFGAILITVVTGQFSLRLMRDSLLATIRVSAMILMLIAASSFLSAAIAYMQLPTQITEGISALQLSPYGVLLILAALYIVLGMFLDGTSMTVMTVPIAVPLIVQAGFDPLWFGIYLVIMIEMSALTPPVGLNLFVLQGLTQRTMGETVRATLPFFLLLCLGTVILAVFPEIVLWLPSRL